MGWGGGEVNSICILVTDTPYIDIHTHDSFSCVTVLDLPLSSVLEHSKGEVCITGIELYQSRITWKICWPIKLHCGLIKNRTQDKLIKNNKPFKSISFIPHIPAFHSWLSNLSFLTFWPFIPDMPTFHSLPYSPSLLTLLSFIPKYILSL